MSQKTHLSADWSATGTFTGSPYISSLRGKDPKKTSTTTIHLPQSFDASGRWDCCNNSGLEFVTPSDPRTDSLLHQFLFNRSHATVQCMMCGTLMPALTTCRLTP